MRDSRTEPSNGQITSHEPTAARCPHEGDSLLSWRDRNLAAQDLWGADHTIAHAPTTGEHREHVRERLDRIAAHERATPISRPARRTLHCREPLARAIRDSHQQHARVPLRSATPRHSSSRDRRHHHCRHRQHPRGSEAPHACRTTHQRGPTALRPVREPKQRATHSRHRRIPCRGAGSAFSRSHISRTNLSLLMLLGVGRATQPIRWRGGGAGTGRSSGPGAGAQAQVHAHLPRRCRLTG
jgi:hypothetical protein